jgi:hypothetical protein
MHEKWRAQQISGYLSYQPARKAVASGKQVMKTLSIILLFTLSFSGFSACVQVNKSERRVVELPKSDSRTSLTTCESIVRDLAANGLFQRVHDKFPQLTDAQRKGLFMTWNEGNFQNGKSVFIMTGINYQGDLNQAKEVADFLESEVKKAVESFFAKPIS